MKFTERDVTQDPSAIEELQRMGLMTTPVVVVSGRPVVGFDESALRELLELR